MSDRELLGPWAVSAARELLPAWVIWGQTIASLALVTLVPLALGHVALARFGAPLAAAGLHWTERARHAHRLRVVILAGCLCPMALVATLVVLFPNELSPIPTPVLVALVLLAGEAAHFSLQRSFARRLRQESPPWRAAARQHAISVVLDPTAYLTIVLALLVPRHLGGLASLATACGVLLLVFFAMGGGLLVLRALGLARPLATANPDEHAASTGPLPLGGVVLRVDDPHANAFAFPAIRRILVSEQALAVLDAAELAAVLEHEREHLREPWLTLSSRFTGLLLCLLLALWNPLVGWVGGEAWLTALLVLFLIAQGTRSRRRRAEERADAAAVARTANSATYARALERLHEANLVPAVMGRKHSHPDLYERMLAAGVQPEYVRPEPPPRLHSAWAVSFAVVGVALTFLGARWLNPGRVDRADRSQVHGSIAFRGRTADWLDDLGLIEYIDDEFERAARFERAAATLDAEDPYYAAALSLYLSGAGQCAEARAALDEGERRSLAWPKEEDLDDLRTLARESLAECERASPSESGR